MSALAVTSPAVSRSEGEALRLPILCEDLGGEPTLDELVSGAWEGLAAHNAVPCPVCGGVMAPEYGVHARPIGGRCRGCDTTLR